MQGYNCIVVFNKDRDKILLCKRTKDPYKGLYNLVGGKIDKGEEGFLAAYRELEEETGIGSDLIELSHMMDFTYYNQGCVVEIYVGTLQSDVALIEEQHPLVWLDAGEDFFDLGKFAGEGNIGHIVEQVKRYGEGKRRNPQVVYYDGAKIPFGDAALLLHIEKRGSKNRITMQGKQDELGQMHLTLTTLTEKQEQLRSAAVMFFRNYAKTVLSKKTLEFAKKMGVEPKRITIKEQKTRWGSCSSKGNINYNWKLIMMPEKISDYIVVHELAHLKHMDHSHSFWAEVQRILPDYMQRKEWLKLHETEYRKY